MPWDPSDASSKTRKASTPKLKRQWSSVANNVLERTGDDARAIRSANAVVSKARGKGRASNNVVRRSR